MADINDGSLLRFDNGGKVVLVTTGDNVILNIVSGTLRVQEGGREISVVTSAGVPLPPRLGDHRLSTVEVDVYLSEDFEADGLYDLMSHAEVDDATAPEFDLAVELYDDIGATTGNRLEFADCHFTQPWNLQAGGDGASPDRLQLRIASREIHGTWSAIAPTPP